MIGLVLVFGHVLSDDWKQLVNHDACDGWTVCV
jgi:hypothetical protein